MHIYCIQMKNILKKYDKKRNNYTKYYKKCKKNKKKNLKIEIFMVK